jgi:hypothetical protein
VPGYQVATYTRVTRLPKPESTDCPRPADEKAGKWIQVDDESQRGVERVCGPLRGR